MLTLESQTIESLKHIIQLMPGNIYWKDVNGHFLGCNNNVAKILNLDSADAIFGKTNYDLFDHYLAKLAEDVDKKVMLENKPYELEEIGLDVDGNRAIYFTNKIPLHSEQGEVVGVLGISIDISDRKHAEAELLKAKENAETANKAKTDFIHNMEHDIRTPLGGIIGMAQALAEQETDDEKQESLVDISHCAQELLDYCNNILSFSKIETGSLPVVEKSFELPKLVNSVINMEMTAAKQKHLALKLDYDHALPKVLRGDSFRIKTILINLVSNAVKFTKEGEIKLKVQLVEQQFHSRSVVVKFEISDTGIGISPEQKDQIYERFTKMNPSNRGVHHGQGLGLRIVKQFIHDLDGDIHLESELDQGARFSLFILFKSPLSDEIIDGG